MGAGASLGVVLVQKDDIRPSLKRAKLEFKRQSCVFWVLFIYKNDRKKLEFPEMGGSALTGGVRTRVPGIIFFSL